MPSERLFTNGEVYHVMNKSIAGYKIFISQKDYRRFEQALRYFAIAEKLPKMSEFLDRVDVEKVGFEKCLEEYFGDAKRHVQIIAYCLMPTHIHLVLKQLQDHGISTFMSNILNSYTRYLNTKQKRRGPLWVGRFKSVHVETDEQLTHLTRYLHLNPTTADLIAKPEDWQWSSYHEYAHPDTVQHPLCQFSDQINMNPKSYKKFTEDQQDYQRELGTIKKIALE